MDIWGLGSRTGKQGRHQEAAGDRAKGLQGTMSGTGRESSREFPPWF